MNVQELQRHLQAIGVRPSGVEFFIESALSPPNIHLRSGPHNNIVGYVSTTLRTYLDDGVQGKVVSRLQVASMSAEHAYVVHLESLGNVLLALNHPRTETFCITNALGRSQRINYTTDNGVVTKDSAWVTELKTDEGARELVKDRPTDWRCISGRYEYLSAKAHFAEMGIEHRVIVSSELPWIRTRNLQMLARLPKINGETNLDVECDIIRFVRANSPCSLEQLIHACHLDNAIPVLRLIENKRIHVDIDRAILASPDSKVICDTLSRARNVATAIASIQAVAKSGATASFGKAGDPEHLDELGFRIAFLAGQVEKREGEDKSPSLRSKQRWKKAERENGKLALTPKWSNCGSDKPRTPRWHRNILKHHLRKARSATTAMSRTQAHLQYKTALRKAAKRRKASEKHISFGYFCKLWKRRDHNVSDAASRGGRRAANAVAPHGDVDKQAPIATGPFQVAHIDHCLVPSHAKSSPDDDATEGQPWLTLLVDAWDSEPLAIWITFNDPSSASDLAVLRDCVRRHGRLPHAIFSDHGSDFKGTVLIGSLAVLNVDGLLRGETNPRSGQSVERTFGTMATTICQGHVGFALDIPNARAISSKKHPANGPKRNFEEVRAHCEHLFFDVIPNLPRLDGGPSKLQKRTEFEITYGKQGIAQKMDLKFLIATAPPLKESGSIEPSGALRLADKRFYSQALIGFSSRKKPMLRSEPEDDSIMYFSHRGKWHVAKSRGALDNMGLSDSVLRTQAQSKKRPTKADKDARTSALHSKPSCCAVDLRKSAAKPNAPPPRGGPETEAPECPQDREPASRI